MPFRSSVLIALALAGAVLGALASGGFIAVAPAGAPVLPPIKYYDPLPH